MKYIDAEKLYKQVDGLMARYTENEKEGDCFQQEQPEVDLEKKFTQEYATYHLPVFILGTLCNGMDVINFIYRTARHFYELGLKARKEK